MSIEWRQISRDAGFRATGDCEITITLGGGRRHAVKVEPCENRDLVRLWSLAAQGADLRELRTVPSIFAWTRNRHSDLVAFKVDGRGRLIGEVWVPTAGLSADEWTLWVCTLAQACDRMEYMLTGRDVD